MKIHIVVHESFEGPGAIETWVKLKGHTLSTTRRGHELNVNLPYVQTPETLRAYDYSQINQYLFAFLDYMEAQSS